MDELLEFQHTYEVFRIWTLCACIAGLIGVLIGIYGFSSKNRLYFGIGVTLFGHVFLCLLILMALDSTFTKRAKKAFVTILSQTDITVKVCDEIVSPSNRDSVLSEIILVRDISRHHSMPLDRIPISITQGAADLGIRIRPDSDRKGEYWVYWDKYKNTSEYPIGFIQTNKFDNIKCR